ncbi:MFS transporter [Granulosicoccus sp. 3-233]
MNRHDLSSTLSFLQVNARWLVGGMMLTVFSSFGQAFFISLFGSSLRASLSMSNGQFGAIFMLSTLASAASFLFIGRLVDRYPARFVALGACLALSMACLGMSLVSSTAMLLLVLYALRLLGQGLLPHIAMVCMARWYVAERGRAVAVASLGHQMGVALLPLLVVSLLARADWRSVWLLGALSLLLVALPVIHLLMRVERKPRGVVTVSSDEAEQPGQWTYREVAGDPYFWLTLMFVLIPAFAGTSVIFHQAHISDLKGWSASLIAGGMTAMSVGNVAALLLSGQFVDRRGASRLLPVFLLPFALACLVLSGTDQAWGLLVFMVLLGISQGMSTTLFGTLFAEIYGTQHLGSIRALLMSAIVLATALGPGLSGYLIDHGVSVDALLRGVAVYALCGAAALWGLSRVLVQRVGDT